MIKETKTAGHAIKTLLSDNGGEFDNKAVLKILNSYGIQQRLTMPYTPEQNGCCERDNRTLVEAARTMMHAHEELPIACWSELVNTAAYVINKTGPTPVVGKSPFELWFGKEPSIKHLKVIGTECYAHVPKQKRTKMCKKAKKCLLIGYNGDDGYRLLCFNKHNDPILVRSRDVTFNESVIRSVGLISDVSEMDEDGQNSLPKFEIHLPRTNENYPMFDARQDVLQDASLNMLQPQDIP